MSIRFIRWGFYADIFIPFTNRVVIIDGGWRGSRPWDYSNRPFWIGTVGWRYKR